MNTSELSAVVAARTGVPTATVRAVLDATLDEIGARLTAGEDISLSGFGTFQARDRAARVGRNPKTGEAIAIPAARTPAFKPFAALKSRVRGA